MSRISCALLMSLFLLMGSSALSGEPSPAAEKGDSKQLNGGSEPAPLPSTPAVSTPTPTGALSASSVSEAHAKAPVETPKTSSTSSVAAAPPLSHDNALKVWKFLKENGKDARPEMVETTLFQLNDFLRHNADWDFSDEALLLKSDLHVRRGEYKFAIVDILELIYEYPKSRSVFQAKSSLAELLEKKIDKKLKPIIYDIAKGSDVKEKKERLAQLLGKLTEQAGDALYEPLVEGYDNFFYRFPAYAGTDELNALFGDLHAKKEKYLTALTYYRKVLALYPDSPVRPRAQRSIGDLYVGSLKNMNEAVSAYQEVINRYPDSEEAGYAYEQTAKLEEQLKHYDLSVELYEKIIQLYPDKEIALRALTNEARLLRDQMEKPDEAIRTFGRLADMFKGSDDAAAALKAAAVTARKQKRYDVEVAMYMRFVNECPSNKEAPEIYYQAAQVTEEDMKKLDQAIELYGQVAEKYPDSKLAKKAKGRIKVLVKKK